MKSQKKQNRIIERRERRVRLKIRGNIKGPRLSIFKSNSHIYVQLIDDTLGETIIGASSIKEKKGKNMEQAKKIGAAIAMLAKEKGIRRAVCDRGSYRYHGIVKAIVEEARKNGLYV